MKPFFVALFLGLWSLAASAHPLDRAKVPQGWSHCVVKGDVVWEFRRLEEEKTPTYACITYTPLRRPAKFKGPWRSDLPDFLKLAIWQKSGKSRPKRLNTVAIDSKELLMEPLTPQEVSYCSVFTESAWLKPSTKQSPILILHGTHGNWVNGNQWGKDIFLTFPGGYENVPVKLALAREDSLDLATSNTLGPPDERGFTSIRRVLSAPSYLEGGLLMTQDFLWSGSSYVEQEIVDHQGKKPEPVVTE